MESKNSGPTHLEERGWEGGGGVLVLQRQKLRQQELMTGEILGLFRSQKKRKLWSVRTVSSRPAG